MGTKSGVSGENPGGGTRPRELSLRPVEALDGPLAEAVSEFLWSCLADGRIDYANRRFREYVCLSCEELGRRRWQDFVHPRDLAAARGGWAEAKRSGERFALEYRHRGGGGEYRWFEARMTPLQSEDGRAVRWLGSAVDITERKEAEEALAHSEERYRAVVEQSAEGIYLVDAASGRILESNAALQRMLGYGPGELEGMLLYDLISHDRGSIDENFRRALADGQRMVGERRYRRKDGTLLDVEVGASVISYGDKRELCAVIRDVSGRKDFEKAIAGIRDAERRRISRDLHDTVLQDLAAALQTLQADMVEAGKTARDAAEPSCERKRNPAVDALRRALQGLREAVHDLRPEKERSLSRLVESLVELHRQLTPEREVSLRVEEDFPAELSQTVKVELARVVQEALANTRRHSKAGRIEVALSAEGGTARIEIRDDGHGFAPESVSGGMGLSAMRERAHALCGELELLTSPGAGTRVIVRVPVRQ